jgi:myo-inositol-1(or 4)-monophosphatase
MSLAGVTAQQTAEYLECALRLAKSAGAIISEAFAQPAAGYDRKSATDPVTETDLAVEAHIFSELRSVYPSHSTIGEESGSNAEHTDAPTWIVDVSSGATTPRCGSEAVG